MNDFSDPNTGKPRASDSNVGRLTLLYILALSLVALLSVLGQFLIQLQLHRQLGDSRVVNIAGRQRMLSQKICKEILAWNVTEKPRKRTSRLTKLRESVALWKESHQGLQHGDEKLGLPGANSEQLSRMFLILQEDYEAMLHSVEELMVLAPKLELGESEEEVDRLVSSILSREDDYLSGMDAIVFQYDREAAERVRSLRSIEMALLFSTLSVLLAEGFLIFRPAAKKIRTTLAALQETTRELFRAKSIAETANQQKSAFLANISHDLRTPMNGIIGLTELAMTTEDRTLQNQYLSSLSESAESLLLLLNDLIDLSKIEADKIDLRLSTVRTQRIVEWLEGMLAQDIQAKSLNLSIEIADGVPRAFLADELRLQQVLMNLLVNAIKFTDRGGISLCLDVVAEDEEERLSFQVIDTGIGITQEDAKLIFESFTQIGSSSDRPNSGAGLGLAICTRLIQEFGGELKLDSEPGKGSTFSFSIPLENREHLLKEESQQQDVARGASIVRTEQLKGCRVLVVEDTQVNQLVIDENLRRSGCVVTIVGNGNEALSLLEQKSFDVVLMDVQLPGIDGLEVTRKIRLQEENSHKSPLPIIALTAHAMDEDRDRCLSAGMNDYLSKPIRTQLLLNTILKTLGLQGTVETIDVESNAPEPWTLEEAEASILARLSGRRDVLEELITLALRELPKGLEEIKHYLASADFPQAAVASHRVKGLVSNLAASRAEQLAQDLETACKEEKASLVHKAYSLLEAEVNSLCREMSSYSQLTS